jgi:hypothetical protein
VDRAVHPIQQPAGNRDFLTNPAATATTEDLDDTDTRGRQDSHALSS